MILHYSFPRFLVLPLFNTGGRSRFQFHLLTSLLGIVSTRQQSTGLNYISHSNKMFDKSNLGVHSHTIHRVVSGNNFATSSSKESSAVDFPESELKKTVRALSIQSHTVHGYVGNKAATFPLQCMGINVDAVNTVTLSNHPGYSKGCKGKSLSAEDVTTIIDGLEDNSLLSYDLVLTGYTRSVEVAIETAKAIKKILAINPYALYVLDPVLGDDGKFYVPKELVENFTRDLLPLAYVITPNQFEAEALSGIRIHSMQSALEACRVLHSMGPNICILKGLQLSENEFSPLKILLSAKVQTETFQEDFVHICIDAPKIDGKFSGCGDLFTAIIGGLLSKHTVSENTYTTVGEIQYSLSHKWTIEELAKAIEYTVDVMSAVISATKETNSRELRIVESFNAYRHAVEGQRTRSRAYETPTPRLDRVDTFPPPIRSIPIRSPDLPKFPHAYVASGNVTGIIFDMDGTLTEPGAIDFTAMYRRTQLKPTDGDLITQINSMIDDKRRKECNEIIIEEEMIGCEKAILRPDLHTFLNAIHNSRIRIALSTRNCELAYHKFLNQSQISEYRFFPAVARETLGELNKPDPRVATHILNAWNEEEPGKKNEY